jgi:S-formylglutathione hydrolase FrmB
MTKIPFLLILLLLSCINEILAQAAHTSPGSMHGYVVTEKLSSSILKENRVGLETERSIKIYLPPGYQNSGKAYPVVYYCHNMFWNAEKVFQDGNLVRLLEKGFERGVVKELIFVVADYSTALTGSLYENSPVSGRWLDFTTQELVPFIDKRFRTLPHRESRALAGDFMGGRGALKLAMTHADIFGSVYALHPVAVGMGHMPWSGIGIDWKKIHQAKTFDDLTGNFREQIFLRVCQAFLPNLNRPPFYCDFFADLENGVLKPNTPNMITAKAGFHLEETLNESVANLKSLRGIAFDWGRFDANQDHVYANQTFSKKLEDLGVEHEAEEYRGDPFNQNWTENGRFYARMLPFFARNLVF